MATPLSPLTTVPPKSYPLPSSCDVVVVGGGNAGFSAALAARENGAKRVVILEKGPVEWAGGNSFFTAGAFRTVHDGLDDLLPLVNNVDAATAKLVDLPSYTATQFAEDLRRVTAGRSDKQLGKALVGESREAIGWLAKHGVRFQLSFNRQAYQVGGRFKFWGGLALKTEDGGKGLMADHRAAAEKIGGIAVCYGAAAKRLVVGVEGEGLEGGVKGQGVEREEVQGVEVEVDGVQKTIQAAAVVLAAGGFEANPQMRAQFLGPGWDLALVRGTPFNTGDGLTMALDSAVGGRPAGNWSGCHATAWDATASPQRGDRVLSNQYTKSGYPLGVMVSVEGQRFVDEGQDLRNYTYARFGQAIRALPDGRAFQIWDAQASPWLRTEEYSDSVLGKNKIVASSVEDLAAQLAKHHGLRRPDVLVATLHDYNTAVYAFKKAHPDVAWDPAIKDGLSTEGLSLPKSNWALPLDKPSFVATVVGCGITFTFGGLAIDPTTAGVLSIRGGPSDDEAQKKVIPGLFCAGEMVGGLFYGNYPGGSGLTSGTVFGRRAGKAAAERANEKVAVKANL